MPFDRYPNPPTSPLSVGAGATSALIGITQQFGPDNVAEAGTTQTDHPTTMFIRLALLAAVAPPPGQQPTIILKANTGAETEITGGFTPIPDGVNVDRADGITHLPDANNVYLIKVLIYDTSGLAWQIRIKNNDAVLHEFTWVIADSLANSRQPWIDAPATTLDFDALTSQSPAPRMTVSVANKGTGELIIGNLVGSDAGDPNFTVAEVPGAIAPNLTGDLKVDFIAPAAISDIVANFDIATNDASALSAAGHNRRVPLHGVARQLELALLVDASGSMGYTPAGDPAIADTDARWGKMKAAAKQFLDLLANFVDANGTIGIGVFPDFTGPTYPASVAPCPSSADIFPVQPINAANITDAKNKLDAPPPALTPRKAEMNKGGTPIGHGIGHTIGTTPLSFAYFSGAAQALSLNKRFLVLMSDGANNCLPPDPSAFYEPGTISFTDKKVKVITIGYGDPASGFEVDHTLLTTIATESGGLFLDAGADDAGLNLKKDFRAALVAGLSLDPTTDPSGLLTPGKPEARHLVTITPYDTKAAFVVNWKKFDKKRVTVTLLTPTCELITAASPATDPNITFRNHETYAIFSFNHDYLRNAAKPTSPRYGTWQLIISGNLADKTNEPYDFEVITESRLKLTLTPQGRPFFAGDKITLEAALTLDGKGIPNAAVTLRLTAPGQSSDNWLAGNLVTAAEFSSAKRQQKNPDLTALGIKAFALKKKGVRFDLMAKASDIKMTDNANDGHYTASFTSTTTPGTYDLYVTAVGTTDDGVTFRREKRLNLRVGVRPDPAFTIVDTIYSTQVIGTQVIHFTEVRVTPRDRFGNVVLVDPAFDSRIAITVKGAEFTKPLTWNLDASYSRTVKYSAGVTPAIGLSVDKKVILPARALTPIDRLRYVDRVIDFHLGGEAEKGANKYTDPNAAVGDITKKTPDPFVSLGALGELTVSIEGQLISAQGDDDVTVFVHPDDSPRPYRVEALRVTAAVTALTQLAWVSLGTSSGVTQSFSLRKAGLASASAIRIIDKSGRTRNTLFKTSITPGVSIKGVGVKATSPFPGGIPSWQQLTQLIIQLLRTQRG